MAKPRSLIPCECGHPEDTGEAAWPGPPSGALNKEDEALFMRRKGAVIDYANGTAYEIIRARHDLSDDEVRRLVARCVRKDQFGRIAGFFALVPRARIGQYERVAPTHESATGQRKASRGGGSAGEVESGRLVGFAGVLEQVLNRFPDVRAYIHEELERPTKKFRNAKARYSRIQAGFVSRLRGRVSENEWPFSTSGQGYGAICAYCRRYIAENPRATDQTRHGKATAEHRPFDPSKARLLPTFRFLQGLQMDYNLVDAADVFTIGMPNGTEVKIPVKRWYWGAIACSSSGTIVGIHIALERSPSAAGAMGLVGSILRGLRFDSKDWQLTYTEDGRVLANCFFPELLRHGMAYIKLDRAWANKAFDSVTNIGDIFGCAINFGTVYAWYERDVIEGAFRRVSEIGPKATAASYGTGPRDPGRHEPISAAIKAGFSTEHLVALIYGAVSKINTSPSRTVDGLTPVEAVGQALRNPDSGVFPMPVPIDDRYPDWLICAERSWATVRNGGETKRTAHINKIGCDYHHWELSASDKYVGKRLLVYMNLENANDVLAVLEDRSKVFYPMVPERHWEQRPHSIAIRRAIIAQYRGKGRDAWSGHDPVVKLGHSLAARALKEGKHISKRTSDAVRELAQFKIETGISILPFESIEQQQRLLDEVRMPKKTAPPKSRPRAEPRDVEDVDYQEEEEEEVDGIDVSRFQMLEPPIRRRVEDD